MSWKIRIEIRKIEQGIAVMPLVAITNCSMHCNRFLVVVSLGGWRVGRLLVSWGLPTPNFALIGNDGFWSCHTDSKMSPENGNGEFSWICRRNRVPVQSREFPWWLIPAGRVPVAAGSRTKISREVPCWLNPAGKDPKIKNRSRGRPC